MIDETIKWLKAHPRFYPQDLIKCETILDHLKAPKITNKLFFHPGHLTASAMILSPDRKQILLIYHSAFQAWIQPGGHLDPGDQTPLETAKREVAEECMLYETKLLLAYPSLLQVDIHDVPANTTKGHPAHQHFDLRFAFVAQTLDIQAASDAKAAQWVSIDDFDPTQSDSSVTESVHRLKGLLA
ncbi:MAG: NUDIX domain-containing protein [Myxococcota bacterium]|nr:NUDIX domain-containing protein [Myxococcota bacterium]